jgi:hypothetical protein
MATRTTEMKTLGEAGEDGRAKMERAYSVVSLLPYIPSIFSHGTCRSGKGSILL